MMSCPIPHGDKNLIVTFSNGSRWDLQNNQYDVSIMLNTVACYFYQLNAELRFSGKVSITSWDIDYPLTEWNATDPTCRTIYLASDSLYWSQQVYQLAHELTHYFIRGTQDDHNNWFYEALAELASNYFLLKMAGNCKNSSDQRFQQYASSLSSYQQQTSMYEAPDIDDVSLWLRKNESYLLSHKEARCLNAQVAKLLFPYFQKEKDIWNILLFAPHQNTCLADLFLPWEKAIPDQCAYLRRHIEHFRSVFYPQGTGCSNSI